MAEAIKMPKMSDTMTEGVIAEWHKKVGDKVKSGDILADVETDKATMELENFDDGVLLYIGPKQGEAVPVDSLIAIVGKEGEDISALIGSGGTPAPQLEAAKAPETTTHEAPKAAVSESISPVAPRQEEQTSGTGDDRTKASPLAKALAKEKGIDLHALHGSGEGGRIVKRDVLDAKLETAQPIQQVVSSSALPGANYEDVPVSQMRKTIARRLAESKFTAPHFYLTIDIDMAKAKQVREQLNVVSPVKLSFNDLVIKACASALRLHPEINSSWLGDKIRINHNVNIGMAVAVEEGLLVPVIRNADMKSLSKISAEAKEFGAKAKEKKLQPADWEGNTFTISNLGMMGIDEFTAIINPPDACILAVGSIREVPVVREGQIVPGSMMKVTLSCDHRVVDGAKGANFLKTLREMLEDPIRMMI